jgi:Uma2 family endonuclease
MAAASVLPVETTAEPLMPVEVYLRTTYRPDCEYIDGEILERNVGERPHGTLQNFFGWFFRNHEDEWQFQPIPEQRVQITSTRYRIPDVCIMRLPLADKGVIRTPPAICVEVLSRADRMIEMQERVDDYIRMGVQAVWVIDPWRRKASIAGQVGSLTAAGEVLTLQGTPIAVPVADIFAELDRYGL